MRALAALVAALILGASGAFAAETEVRLTRLPDKTYEVSGRFFVSASTAIVWEVLMDYDHIPAFVSSMRFSRVREPRADGAILVEQEAVGGLFFLSRTMRVLLEIRRSPGKVRFTDVGREDFKLYDGDWQVRSSAEGADVAYHLHVSPRFRGPTFIVGPAAKRGARRLLEEVRAEIVRRERTR